MGSTKSTRYWVVVNEDGTESSVYKGPIPRSIAIKAVKDRYNVGDTGTIRIRERGTAITKIYSFEVTSVPRPAAVKNLPEKLRAVKLFYKGSVKNYASLMGSV